MRKLASILVIVIALTAMLAGCSKNTTNTTPAPNTATTPAKEATITKDEYDKVGQDTTYEDTVKIVGGEGKIISEAGTKGSPDYTVTYQFPAEGKNGNAKFTFRNNKLTSKSESNL